MAELKELNRETIVDAITKIKENPDLITPRRESTTYDLIHEGRKYPPILVLSEANKLAGGEKLTLSDFNNSTDQAFSILKELGFKVTTKNDLSNDELILKNCLSSLGIKNTSKFFEYISKIVNGLDLSQGDSRVVYSIRSDQERVIFTVGQRYCLTLQNTNDKAWGFITNSKDINSNTVEVSEFEGPVKAYWNKTDLSKDVEESLDKIKDACSTELERTTKSGYLKFNNSSFEKAVFDEKYREEIYMDTFNKSTENKPEPFVDTLKKFLEQSQTDDLSYAHYRSNYNGLNVRVSFGKGNAARIPWISFLGDSQSTNEGIYPVYLLYKKRNLLVLAYGVSEENEPSLNWDIENAVTIKKYFQENDLGNPERYGSSYIYKVYDLRRPINDYPIDKDLYDLTKFYKEIISDPGPEPKQALFNLDLLKTTLNNSHLIYTQSTASRFVSALLTKPFLILTGLSGSGKTKLAQAFAKWIIEEEKQLNLVPVGADWTNREPLLGYPNALEKEQYVLPESGVLQLILNAQKDPSRPYFLILDEMNLSHVERYFADFLSAIESNEHINLHSGEESWAANEYQVPPTLTIPKNFFIIGTVNIDETTYMFSPKVLDRANVIEFRVSRDEMKSFLGTPANVDLSELEGKGSSMAKDFVKIATNPTAEFTDKSSLSNELIQFFENLSEVGAEFGYRTAYEINRFASLAEHMAKDWGFEQIMDAAISQKLLPKLHGSRRKLESVLFKLGQLCIKEGDAEELLKKSDSIDWENNVKYPISLEKIVRMHKGLLENGFTSFAEA
ncbi:McrB family protein [Gracilimonas sp. Q87]|uniref:McrB family protein n=1 Tax=Gracilimonas sp. Q87 TaxID=3384766 RepID=UPI0039841C65